MLQYITWIDQPELGNAIRSAREAKRLSQGRLAEAAMVAAGFNLEDRRRRASIQVALSALESGVRGHRAAKSDYLPWIEEALGIPLRRDGTIEQYDGDDGTIEQHDGEHHPDLIELTTPRVRRMSSLVAIQAQARYPVYNTAPHPTGSVIVNFGNPQSSPWMSDFPNPGIFGIRQSSRAMEPAYRAGDIIWFNPAVAPQDGDECLFEPASPETNSLRRILHLEGKTFDSWIVRQYSPESIYLLPKAEWPKAFKVEGKQSR